MVQTILISILMLGNGLEPNNSLLDEQSRDAGMLWQGVDFEQWPQWQSYSYSMAGEDFGNYPNFFNSPLLTWNAYLAAMPEMGTVMRIIYREGLYSDTGSGAIWRAEFSQNYRDLTLEFNAFFGEDFEFVRGGKFHGLCSSNCYTGGSSVPGDGMSVRFMWRSADSENRARIVAYVYHTDMPGIYGQDIPLLHGGPNCVLLPDSRIYYPDIDETFLIGYEDRDYVGPWPVIRFDDGNWYNLKIRVYLNDPGVRNGAIQAWINDELVLNITGFLFAVEGVSESDYLLKYFLFQTFHGGGDTSWAPSKDVFAFYDDFKVTENNCASRLSELLTKWSTNDAGSPIPDGQWNILDLVKCYPPLLWTCSGNQETYSLQ